MKSNTSSIQTSALQAENSQKHNEATTMTPRTTCTKTPIQNTKQHGYHTNYVQRYDRVQTRHSKRVTDRKNTEEEDVEIATRKETQSVKKRPSSCMSTLCARGQNVLYKVQQKNVTRKSKHSKISAQCK